MSLTINGNIPVQFCEEDRKRLDTISDTLELIRLAIVNGATVAPVVNTAAEEIREEPASEEPIPEEAASESAGIIDLSDIQKKVVELSAAGKKAEVRDIITKYANRVSAIPAEKTAEVWDQLTGLES